MRKEDLHSLVTSIFCACTVDAKNFCHPQVTTWLAITFHQLFEGMGLGARVARLEWHRNAALKKFFMCLAYNLTTPIGMAIVS